MINIILFLLGIIVAVGSALIVNIEGFDSDFIRGFIPLSVKHIDSTSRAMTIYLIVGLIAAIFCVCILRYFVNRRNLKFYSGLGILLFAICFTVPFTIKIVEGIMYMLAYATQVLERDEVIVSLGFILGMTIIFFVINEIMYVFIHNDYRREQKRCILQICRVVNEHTIEVIEERVRNVTFTTCFKVIEYNKNTLPPRQFFKIVEYNWNKKEEIDSWRYYQDSTIIRCSDEDLYKQLMVGAYAKDISWQG